ncbi:MAG TPA: two-component regulator propeller domain-containing protein [Candidatus Eisenbacteria bacterium]
MNPAILRRTARSACRFLLLLLVFMAGVSQPARAQQWTAYANPNDIKDITQINGDLWMATTGGALYYDFDANLFHQVTRRAAGGPLSQLLTSVAYDSVSGLMFFGSEDLGVSQYDPVFERWERFEFVPDNRINNVSALDGEVQIGTAAGFAIRRTATRTDICNDIDRGCCGSVPGSCDFPNFDVREWASPADGRLWAATAGGPAEFDGVKWTTRAIPGLTDIHSVEAINGVVYAAGAGSRQVYRWNGETQAWQAAAEGLRDQGLGDAVRLVNTGGSLYLCANYGLFRRDGASWVSTGLEDHTVRSVVAVDILQADLAAATRDGLFVRRLVGPGTQWEQRLAPGPPQRADGQAVAGAPDGTLWIGTLGGVQGLTTEGEWLDFRNGASGGLAPFDLFSIYAARDNKLWVGKCCCHSVPNCPTQFIEADDDISPVLSAWDGWGMAEDSQGRLWIGSNSTGLTVLGADGTHITDIPPASGGLASPSVRALATRNNDVWIGHEQRGLQILRTGGNPANPAGFMWKTFTPAQLPDNAIAAIEIRDRDTYVLTSSYLVQYTDEVRVRQWPLNFDGEPRRGTGLAVDRKGNRWIGTTAGVVVINTAGESSLLTTRNSDLIADDVIDVDLDPRTGDILFATRIGTNRLVPGAGPKPGGDAERYLFPNPFHADGSVRVKIGGGSADNAEVFDLAGRSVARFDPASGWDGSGVDGATVAPGIYLVVLDGAEPLRLAVLR